MKFCNDGIAFVGRLKWYFTTFDFKRKNLIKQCRILLDCTEPKHSYSVALFGPICSFPHFALRVASYGLLASPTRPSQSIAFKVIAIIAGRLREVTVMVPLKLELKYSSIPGGYTRSIRN